MWVARLPCALHARPMASAQGLFEPGTPPGLGNCKASGATLRALVRCRPEHFGDTASVHHDIADRPAGARHSIACRDAQPKREGWLPMMIADDALECTCCPWLSCQLPLAINAFERLINRLPCQATVGGK